MLYNVAVVLSLSSLPFCFTLPSLKPYSDDISYSYVFRKETKQWDRFIQSNNDNISSEDVTFWDNVFVVTKIVVAFLLFFLTLGTAVVSKVCFTIITANIFPSVSTDGGDLHNKLKTVNGTLTYESGKTNVQWIWALTMLIGTPYLFSSMKLSWRLLFQMHHSKKKLDWATLFVVSFFYLYRISNGLSV